MTLLWLRYHSSHAILHFNSACKLIGPLFTYFSYTSIIPDLKHSEWLSWSSSRLLRVLRMGIECLLPLLCWVWQLTCLVTCHQPRSHAGRSHLQYLIAYSMIKYWRWERPGNEANMSPRFQSASTKNKHRDLTCHCKLPMDGISKAPCAMEPSGCTGFMTPQRLLCFAHGSQY